VKMGRILRNMILSAGLVRGIMTQKKASRL